MKKLLVFNVLIAVAVAVIAQNNNIVRLKKQLVPAQADSSRFKILDSLCSYLWDSKQDTFMHYLKQEFELATRNNNTKWKATAYSECGRCQYVAGNYPLGLQWEFKSLQLAESIHDSTVMANDECFIGVTYKEYEDYIKAKRYFLQFKLISERLRDFTNLTWSYLNLGEVYNKMNIPDSALLCTQQGYAMSLKNHNQQATSMSLVLLGNVQKNLHNKSLALEYYMLGIEGLKKESGITRLLSKGYLALADFYKQYGVKDSAIYFARISMNIAKQVPYIKGIASSARFLSVLYDSLHQTDSAFCYQNIYVTTNDSLNSRNRTADVENLTMLEQIRQQEKEQALLNVKEEQKENIQYALLAIGIVTFIILFLLLSRSVITNTRIIELLSVLALLIVFEFLNLLLHPFLERITNHSPLLILLGLVCVAALLVPLHYRVEKWATKRLVEKNKEIRLAAAKRTIEELENTKTN